MTALERTDEYWAGFFGLSTEEFLAPGVRVVPHAGLGDYSGAWLFSRGESQVVSVPPGWVEAAGASVNEHVGEFTREHYLAIFGEAVTRVVGPAYQGYLEPEEFRPAAGAAQLLSEKQKVALDGLARAAGEEEWGHSGLDTASGPIFGIFEGETLVAAGTPEVWAPGVASPGILTHPEFRGRGLAKAVITGVCQYSFGLGHLVVYQTLEANWGAVKVAEAVGFRRYGEHLAVRLGRDHCLST